MLNLKPETTAETDGPTFAQRLGELYRRQDELSRRFDEAGEREYWAVVRQIAALTSAEETK